MKSTAKHLQGSKNFYRGLDTEVEVIEHFGQIGYRLIGRRQRFWGVEVDLVFQDIQGNLCLIEVKSLQSIDFLNSSFSAFQKNRYRRVVSSMRESGQKVRFLLVIKLPHQGILEIPEALET